MPKPGRDGSVLLAALLLAGVMHAVVDGAALPSNMKEWHGNSVFAHKAPEERFWDRAMLEKSVSHLGNLHHFQTFFDKLEAGKKLVVVAFGSSFVHDFAGCWQTSVQALWDLGIIPNPVRPRCVRQTR